MEGPTYQWDSEVVSKLSPAAVPYLTYIISAVLDYYQQQQWDGIQIRSAMSELLLPYVRDVMFLRVNTHYTDMWSLLYQWLTGLSGIMDKIGIHTIYWLFHPLPHEQMKKFHHQVEFHVTQTSIPLSLTLIKDRRKLHGTRITLGEELSRPFIDGMLVSCYHFAAICPVPLWVTLDKVPLTLDDLVATPHNECVVTVTDGTYQVQLTEAIMVEGVSGSWIMFSDPTFLQGWLSYKKTFESILGRQQTGSLPSGPGYWKLLICQDGKWQDATIS